MKIGLELEFSNIPVDVPGKADVLKASTKWCIGSDFPFGSETVYSFDNQIQYFL